MSLSTALVNVITANPQRYTDVDYRSDNASHGESSTINEEEHEKKESRFEVMLLSLGLMINFVQESEKVKDLVLPSPLATQIRNAFEKLISREVIPIYMFLMMRNPQIMRWDT